MRFCVEQTDPLDVSFPSAAMTSGRPLVRSNSIEIKRGLYSLVDVPMGATGKFGCKPCARCTSIRDAL